MLYSLMPDTDYESKTQNRQLHLGGEVMEDFPEETSLSSVFCSFVILFLFQFCTLQINLISFFFF